MKIHICDICRKERPVIKGYELWQKYDENDEQDSAAIEFEACSDCIDKIMKNIWNQFNPSTQIYTINQPVPGGYTVRDPFHPDKRYGETMVQNTFTDRSESRYRKIGGGGAGC